MESRHELRAEAIRDIGILMLVFAPLDTLILGESKHWWDWPLAGILALVGIAFIEIGVRIGAGEP